MSHSLCAFITKAIQRNRISFGDLRRLKRNVLPVGITSWLEVEVLVALDRTVENTGREWSEFLVSAVTEFVVRGAHPPGYVDKATADWVIAALNCGRAKTVRSIARAIVEEAHLVDDVLLPLAKANKLRGKVACTGAANGRFRHGQFTREAIQLRRSMRALMQQAQETASAAGG